MSSIKRKLYCALEAYPYELFHVYDENGMSVTVINRAMVRACIDAGYDFDINHVPYSIVKAVYDGS